MPKAQTFPIKISVGPVVVRITEIKSPTAKAGKLYRVTPPGGGKPIHRADIEEAKTEARTIAAQLAQGVSATHQLAASDVQELHQARVIAAGRNTPLLLALQEWSAAKEYGVPIIESARVLSAKLKGNVIRTMLGDAIVKFKESRRSAKAELTYGAKMKIIQTGLGKDTYIDTLTVGDYTNFLSQFKDNETYNDIRKRIITLMRWAKRANRLPRGVDLEIELTERAPEKKDEERVIGIIKAAQLDTFLHWVHKNHAWALAGAVLGSTLGLRQDEVQGKRTPKMKSKDGKPMPMPEARRQRWEDIYIDETDPAKRILTVTVAKNNTPSMRDMPLTEQSIAWLKLCYVDGEKPCGYVIEKGGAAKLRVLALEAEKELGFRLPANALRHSWITADICHTNGKNAPATALKAGNSVQIIHSRYKGKMKEWEADEYLKVMPKVA